MCDVKDSELSAAVIVKAKPTRKIFRPQTKGFNKIPDDILNNVHLNSAIKKLPENYNFEIHKTIWRIKLLEAKRVALQMPEGLLTFSLTICDILETYTAAETVIMGDVTYGACCIDDFTAKALGVDLLIHYGHSCLIPIDQTSDIKVLYIFVDIKIDPVHFIETVKYNFEPVTKLALVSTVQFVTTLHAAAADLQKDGYSVTLPQERPLSPGEILGCTAPILRNVDSIVYLGDGRFHLEAIMIANPDVKAYRYDPYEKKFTWESYDFEELRSRRSAAVETAKSSQLVGLIFGTLGRQGSLRVFEYLQRQLREAHLKCVNVLISEVSPQRLALLGLRNPDIVWLQTSCPRLSIDWGTSFHRPLLSPYEAALLIGKTRTTQGYPMDYYSAESLGPWAPNYKECCGKGCSKKKSETAS